MVRSLSVPVTTITRSKLDTVIFLDVDGVLHSLYGDDLFVPRCCSALEAVVRGSNASIVLSSTWRTDKTKVAILNSVLQQRRLGPVTDCTKELNAPRGAEICEWLDRHPEVSRWIAIDDMDLLANSSIYAERMRGHFVRTNCNIGLTSEQAGQAIRLLDGQIYSAQQAAASVAKNPVPRRLASRNTSPSPEVPMIRDAHSHRSVRHRVGAPGTFGIEGISAAASAPACTTIVCAEGMSSATSSTRCTNSRSSSFQTPFSSVELGMAQAGPAAPVLQTRCAGTSSRASSPPLRCAPPFTEVQRCNTARARCSELPARSPTAQRLPRRENSDTSRVAGKHCSDTPSRAGVGAATPRRHTEVSSNALRSPILGTPVRPSLQFPSCRSTDVRKPSSALRLPLSTRASPTRASGSCATSPACSPTKVHGLGGLVSFMPCVPAMPSASLTPPTQSTPSRISKASQSLMPPSSTQVSLSPVAHKGGSGAFPGGAATPVGNTAVHRPTGSVLLPATPSGSTAGSSSRCPVASPVSSQITINGSGAILPQTSGVGQWPSAPLPRNHVKSTLLQQFRDLVPVLPKEKDGPRLLGHGR